MKEIRPHIQWYVDQGYGDPFAVAPRISVPLVINAAITGMIPTKEHTPHVPVIPEEIIEDGVRCFRAGARILHLHAREEDGTPSYRSEIYRRIIPAIREQCEGVVICATTSGRGSNSFEDRSRVLHLRGPSRPDMASLTLGSMNFPEQASINSPETICGLAGVMGTRGIIPELEAFEPGMIHYGRYLLQKGILKRPLWFNILLGSLGTMPAGVRDLEFMVESLPTECVWAAAGIGRFQLPVNLLAVLMGGHVRVGLEDNIHFDCGRTVLATNEMLIERLVEFAEAAGRPVATPEQARNIIGLTNTDGKL